MNAVLLDRRFVLPRPGRLLLLLAVGLLLPVFFVVTMLRRQVTFADALLPVMIAVATTASLVAASHKTLLAASPSFFHVGLRRRLLAAQGLWALGQAVVVAVFTRVAYPSVDASATLTAAALALIVHALLTLATLRLTWSYQLPFWLIYSINLLPLVRKATAAGYLDRAFDQPWYALGAAAALCWLVARDLAGPGLHRRLCGSMVLGAEDMFRTSRVQEYRRLGDRTRRPGQGPRWRTNLIGALTDRAGRARLRGDAVAARAWQAVALNAAVNITTRPAVLVLIALSAVLYMLFAGYYDARIADTGMRHWFAGLLFQAALTPMFGLGVALLTAQQAAISRRSAFRGEVTAVGLLMVGSLLISAGLYAMFHVLAAVLPFLDWHGAQLSYLAPRPHGLWLPVMMGPIAWLTVALRPRPQCTVTNVVLGPGFIMGHWLMNTMPYGASVPLGAAISLAAFAAAYHLRRRWWLRADLLQ